MVDANAEESQLDRYPKFFFCFTPSRVGDRLTRLNAVAGKDPVASTPPPSLDEDEAFVSNYQHTGTLIGHASNNDACAN